MADTTPGADTNWADGGPTDLDNGCLLCQRCHTQVHHHGWDIVMVPHPGLTRDRARTLTTPQ
nr:HNH endonuclease [Gordonia terrae]